MLWIFRALAQPSTNQLPLSRAPVDTKLSIDLPLHAVPALKRTWKPRSLRGKEKFSQREADPNCDIMGAYQLNEPAMRFTTRHFIWSGHRNI